MDKVCGHRQERSGDAAANGWGDDAEFIHQLSELAGFEGLSAVG
jgi:hypothetical protein